MTEWAEFVDFKRLTIHKLLCRYSVLKYTWNQQFNSFCNLSLFFILFLCTFQSFRAPWLYKFSFYFCKSVSVCSSPFQSFSVNCDIDMQMNWPCQWSTCTPQKHTVMTQTLKQNKADPCVISAFSTYKIIHNCIIDILLQFGIKYIMDLPI